MISHDRRSESLDYAVDGEINLYFEQHIYRGNLRDVRSRDREPHLILLLSFLGACRSRSNGIQGTSSRTGNL